jgi:hypothetical protein
MAGWRTKWKALSGEIRSEGGEIDDDHDHDDDDDEEGARSKRNLQWFPANNTLPGRRPVGWFFSTTRTPPTQTPASPAGLN